MRFLRRLLMLMFVLMTFASPATAVADNRYKTPDSVTPQEVADGIGGKFVRGVTNIATGWIELPKQIYYTSQEDGLGRGISVGPIKGIIMTLIRTASGAIEVLTFPIPFPGFYDPLFDPPYVWQKE